MEGSYYKHRTTTTITKPYASKLVRVAVGVGVEQSIVLLKSPPATIRHQHQQYQQQQQVTHTLRQRWRRRCTREYPCSTQHCRWRGHLQSSRVWIALRMSWLSLQHSRRRRRRSCGLKELSYSAQPLSLKFSEGEKA